LATSVSLGFAKTYRAEQLFQNTSTFIVVNLLIFAERSDRVRYVFLAVGVAAYCERKESPIGLKLCKMFWGFSQC